VANRLEGGWGVTTEGIRDLGLGGNGSGGRGSSLITPDIFIITTARFGAHFVPPMRHLSAPSLQPTDVKLSFALGTGQNRRTNPSVLSVAAAQSACWCSSLTFVIHHLCLLLTVQIG
jgi:hypothetical protein